MDKNTDESPRTRVSVYTVLVKALQELPRRLPISFYLILAIIVMLLLGVNGFSDLDNPRRLAFTMVLFLVFFGAIVYRALIDAIDIARKHHRERNTLISDVFERDGFAKDLHQRVSEHAQLANESSDSPSNPPSEG